MTAISVFALSAAVLLWGCYGPLAELIFHILHIGTVYRGSDLERDVALTFDDGPDPRHTPSLLDLLDAHGARAVFFVIGEHAREHPELVREIRARGHLVGAHTMTHRNAWFVSPWRTRREVIECKTLLEQLLGEPIVFFRPPWGRFNLALPWALHRAGQRAVLWTFAGRDWREGDTAADVALRVADRLRNGAIVLLHDSGGAPLAPQHTLEALRTLLPRMRQIGLSVNTRPVEQGASADRERKGDFPRRMQRLVHPLWRLWEAGFDRIFRVFPLTFIFRLSVAPWRFGPRQGAGIRDGLPMVEVHFQNLALQRLLRIEPTERMIVRGLREVRDSLSHVARALVYDDRFREAKGIFGMTMMNRGIEGLGFTVEDVPNTFGNRMGMRILRWLMILYHPHGRRRLKEGLQHMQPKLVWMTRDTLLARYLPEAQAQERVPTLRELVAEHDDRLDA
jgi:peptidoglycan/xylan/chitin deacetylase (PgdA/CDA1 family)